MLIINLIIGLALLTVIVTLILGAVNMRKGGMEARMKSNKLMRLRVASQFIAVIALIIMVYMRSKATGG